MIKQFLLFIALLSSFIIIKSQTKSFLYKGIVDSKMPITLYIQSEENGCGADPFFGAVYKYDKVSNWLQLDISKNDKEQYAMVEYGFTGLMILKKDGNTLKGTWISPDGKRQLPVILKQENLTPKQTESYKNILEKVNYENHDC
jgi:hypothetical protein